MAEVVDDSAGPQIVALVPPGAVRGQAVPRSRKRIRRAVYCIPLLLGFAILVVLAYAHRGPIRRLVATGEWRLDRSVSDVLARHEGEVRKRLEPLLAEAGVRWPPRRITLLAFKREKRLEVWGANAQGPFRRLKTYPVPRASGTLGPKRKAGDRQVPEGFYGLPDLNPNSLYHLSIRVGYPNPDDVENAVVSLEKMGSDIFIHGGDRSIGCLAMGDPGIEEIFVLAARVPPENRCAILSPVDFRETDAGDIEAGEPWVSDLYARIAEALEDFRPPE